MDETEAAVMGAMNERNKQETSARMQRGAMVSYSQNYNARDSERCESEDISGDEVGRRIFSLYNPLSV